MRLALFFFLLTCSFSFGLCQNYLPIKCTTLVDDIYYPSKTHNTKQDTLIQLWTYNSAQQLIIDSISFSHPNRAVKWTDKYQYYKDSISIINSKNEASYIKLDSNGLPLLTVTNYYKQQHQYKAIYNADGTLQKIFIDGIRNETIYDIVYKNGNITSYRSAFFYPKDSITILEKYLCKYYSDSIYNQPYNPTFKMWGLRNWENAGRFNVQVFSKSLLRKIKAARGEYYTYFTYELDDKKRIVKIIKNHQEFGIPLYNKYFLFEYAEQ